MLRVWLHDPDPTQLDAVLAAARDARLSYPETGATRDGPLPAGYGHDRYETVLGYGPDVFARAVRGLHAWAAHGRVHPPGARIEPGATLLVLPRIAGLRLAVPCRIVWTVDEPRRFAFAYGTLEGHPERGEEAFSVELAADGLVRFAITAFSRPSNRVLALARPVQMWATSRYLAALRSFVERRETVLDVVEEAGLESFPASDPPTWWARAAR